MSSAPPPSAQEIEELRVLHYNATLVERLDVHSELAIFRVLPDSGVPDFDAGQYVALGLGYWEPRLAGTQPESLNEKQPWRLVRRAYSISCSLLDDQDSLRSCCNSPYLEFYIALIREAEHPPALTPRLFQIRTGNRLYVQPRVVGNYVLSGIQPTDEVVFLGTGTGEAPHNAMAAALLRTGHTGRIVVATCVRKRPDLAYLNAHQRLMKRFANYRYLWYTTREAYNLDPTHDPFVGPERLQTVYENGRLEKEAGFAFSPASTHVFLCGNPMMIGLTRKGEPEPDPPGMLQLLQANGFRDTDSTGPGRIRYEKYW